MSGKGQRREEVQSKARRKNRQGPGHHVKSGKEF